MRKTDNVLLKKYMPSLDRSNDEKIAIKWMCNELIVNTSSFYSYKMSLKNKKLRYSKEKYIVEKIKSIFVVSNKVFGARRIKLELDEWCEQNDFQVVNLKRIRRIMKEQNLISKIRKRNHYKHNHYTLQSRFKFKMLQEEINKCTLYSTKKTMDKEKADSGRIPKSANVYLILFSYKPMNWSTVQLTLLFI